MTALSYLFAERIYGVSWLALAGIAAIIALAYVFLPMTAPGEGLRWFVLRWFHTIAWTFLALAALARSKATAAPVELTAPLAAAGGLVYVAFMLATLYGAAG